MAKVQATIGKPAGMLSRHASVVTAATFSTNGKKGKPSRPKNMQDAEWWKVVANMRVPKALKALQGVARLASLEGGEYTEKQVARILRDIEERVALIRHSFENPEKPVKVVTSRYFS
jgi:hypothetical protein